MAQITVHILGIEKCQARFTLLFLLPAFTVGEIFKRPLRTPSSCTDNNDDDDDDDNKRQDRKEAVPALRRTFGHFANECAALS